MKKKDFLEFLEDDAIQKKIKDIVLSNEVSIPQNDTAKEDELMGIIADLKDKYKKIKECLTQEEQKNQTLLSQNSTLEISLDVKTTQLKSLNQSTNELQKQLDFYKQNFEDELKIYEKFTNLSSETKNSLSGIFKDDTLSGFISCGVQEKNIQNFWEYIKAEILEDKNSDIDKLVEIFYFFFSRYKIAYPMYELLYTKQNESFDTQFHIKHNSSSSSSGAISKVYLQGYKNTKTDKTIKQSVIKI